MNRLRELRKMRGWTLQNVADFIGTSLVSVSRYEREDQRLTLPVMRRLATLYNVSLSDLDAAAVTRPDSYMVRFGENLTFARLRTGGTTAESVAARADIPRGRYEALEEGNAAPSLHELETLARTLQVSVGFLVVGVPPEPDTTNSETPSKPDLPLRRTTFGR